jgi:hypothetical protein
MDKYNINYDIYQLILPRTRLQKFPNPLRVGGFVLKAAPRLELGMEVLQTSALPLGYAATVPNHIMILRECN